VNVLVEGCSFDTVDDNVSIKAGQLPDAAGLGDCENIVFRNCNCVRSAYSGFTIGSQAGAVVRNVFIENCTVSNVINAHYLKTHGNWAGGIENVYIRSNHVYNCNSLLALQPDLYLDQPVIGPPVYANINMQDVTCEYSQDVPFLFEGDPRKPIDGVNLSNITVSSRAKDPAIVSNTVKLSATDIMLNGKAVTIKA
jgi:polygalacturonase